VTFLEDRERIVTENGEIGPFEEGETVELPDKIAEILLNGDSVVRWAWQCLRCGEIHKTKEKPPICQNPNCSKKGPFKSIHPLKHHEQGDVLIDNFSFHSVAESVKAGRGVGKIFLRKNNLYEEDGVEGFIRKKVKELNPTSKNRQETEVIKYIETNQQLSQEKFGLKGFDVALENKILNLETGETRDFTDNDIVTSKIPHSYDPNADAPQWHEFLNEVIDEQKDILTLQEFLGTALINQKLHKKMLMIIGPTDSGKSTLIETIRHVFGKKNMAGESPHSLAVTRWGMDKIFGKMLNASDEFSTSQLKGLDKLKKAADGNPVEAEQKNKPRYTFEPTTEHIFAANQTPDANRNDDAFWNRWLIVRMTNSIPRNKQDPKKAEKLKEEATGILNWIIEGFHSFAEKMEFSHPQEWTEARDAWLDWGSAIQRFIQRCLVRDPENKVASSELYDDCVRFAEKEGLDAPSSQKKLTEEVKKLSYASYSDSYRIDGKQQRGFKGIKIDKSQLRLGV